MPTFKDLRIWQEATRLMIVVDALCKKLPNEERYQLIDQSRRSSSSVSDNIAEGYTSYHYKDKMNRFYDARKEAGETQNHILKMGMKGYVQKEACERLFSEYQLLIRGINGYVNYIRNKHKHSSP